MSLKTQIAVRTLVVGLAVVGFIAASIAAKNRQPGGPKIRHDVIIKSIGIDDPSCPNNIVQTNQGPFCATDTNLKTGPLYTVSTAGGQGITGIPIAEFKLQPPPQP